MKEQLLIFAATTLKPRDLDFKAKGDTDFKAKEIQTLRQRRYRL